MNLPLTDEDILLGEFYICNKNTRYKITIREVSKFCSNCQKSCKKRDICYLCYQKAKNNRKTKDKVCIDCNNKHRGANDQCWHCKPRTIDKEHRRNYMRNYYKKNFKVKDKV